MTIVYDHIGTTYNTPRKADPYLFGLLMHNLYTDNSGTYLEIGFGTGNYTKEFSKRGFRFIGVDPSEEMLVKARQKGAAVDWRKGTTAKLDLRIKSMDTYSNEAGDYLFIIAKKK